MAYLDQAGLQHYTQGILRKIADSANTAAHGVQDVIAEEFDVSSSYSAGDYVYYNGKLYKFTADHATGVFDGTDADEVTVTDEMVNDVTVNGTSVVNNGVAEIPIVPPGGSIYGLVKPSNGTGLSVTNDGKLAIVKANDSQIKTGLDEYRPVVPQKQHISTFYGLAKAAGDTTQAQSSNTVGTYTDEAKTAIKSMLGVRDGDLSIGTVSTLSPGSSATASITGNYNAMELNLGIPRGKSGVYVGATAPADPDVNVWIDTSGGDDFQAIVNAVYAMLPVAEEVGF